MKVPRIIKEGLVIASKGGFSVLVLATKRQMKPVQKYLSELNLDISVEVVLRCPCGRYPERCKCSEDELRSYWNENRKLLDADMIIDGLSSKLVSRFNPCSYGLSPGLLTEDASDMLGLLLNAGKLSLNEFHKVKELAGVIASLSPVSEGGVFFIDDVHILEATKFIKMRTRIENLGYRYVNRDKNLIKETGNEGKI